MKNLTILVIRLYDCGANGIAMAMMSETLRLDSEEREQLAAAACRFGKNRGVVVISVCAESSKTAERYAKHAESVDADAVMAIPPVSIGMDEGELLAHYTRIIHAIQIPVIVQDASGYARGSSTTRSCSRRSTVCGTSCSSALISHSPP